MAQHELLSDEFSYQIFDELRARADEGTSSADAKAVAVLSYDSWR